MTGNSITQSGFGTGWRRADLRVARPPMPAACSVSAGGVKRTVSRRKSSLSSMSGFTLIEMLVAVGLIVLLMSMFAAVFQIATGTMARQKSISENDQKVRLLQQVLRKDLTDRTFREVAAFAPTSAVIDNFNTTAAGQALLSTSNFSGIQYTEDPQGVVPASNIGNRRGYFYIAENVPGNGNDDLLQFTIRTPTSEVPLIGRSRLIPDEALAPNTITVESFNATQYSNQLATNIDQPEGDDGILTQNEATTSFTGEVSYFLRGNTLYRRVLLVRTPLDADETEANPETGSGAPFPRFSTAATSIYGSTVAAGIQRNFFSDYDLSASFDPTSGAVQLHHYESSLDNSGSSLLTLGRPQFRFGHSRVTGLPREYLSDGGTGEVFFGRFSHRETSDSRFGYPGRAAATGAGALDWNLPDNGFSVGPDGESMVLGGTALTGTRWGEDVVLANVHEFDIKVWDPCVSLGVDLQPGIAGVDDDSDGIIDRDTTGAPDWDELGAEGSDDGGWVDLGHSVPCVDPIDVSRTIAHGQYRWINPAAPDAGRNPSFGMRNPYYGPNAPVALTPPPATIPAPPEFYGNRFDTWHIATAIPPSGTTTPSTYAPVADGRRYRPPYRPIGFGADRRPGRAGFDDDGDGLIDYTAAGFPDLEEIGALGSDDARIPLKAIQIRVRFVEPTSNLMRETTFVISLAQ